MNAQSPILTLTDGRRGYFYTTHFTGNPMFQPVDDDDLKLGHAELVDAEDHVIALNPKGTK